MQHDAVLCSQALNSHSGKLLKIQVSHNFILFFSGIALKFTLPFQTAIVCFCGFQGVTNHLKPSLSLTLRPVMLV